MFSIAKILCALGFMSLVFNAQAQADNNYSPTAHLEWQYAGQISAPNHGSPPAWHPGVNYCGTENPQFCNQYGAQCYTNNGYWWDDRNNCNWFNYYECRYKY